MMKFDKLTEKKWYPEFLWCYSLFAGTLVALALPPKLLPGFEWIALIPFFGLLLFPMRRIRDLFFFGWLAGIGAFGFYLVWFFDAAPLIWIGIPHMAASIAFIALGVSLPVMYFALSFGVFLVVIKKLSRSVTQETLFIILLWPVFEYLRTWGYSFHPLAQGTGHIFGDHAGFLLLGYSLAEYDFLRPLASILGSYGMSILVLIPNTALFLVASGRVFQFKRWVLRVRSTNIAMAAAFLIFVFLIFSGAGYILFRIRAVLPENQDRISIAVVQLNSRPEDSAQDPDAHWEALRERIQSLLKKALALSPDIVVMPEGTPTVFNLTPGDSYPTKEDVLGKLGYDKYRLLIDTDLFATSRIDQKKNTTTLIDNQKIVRGVYEKRFLMPWGEYMPHFFIWGAQILGASSWLDYQLQLKSYIPGTRTGVFQTPLGRVGILTCSEILSPKLMRDTARGGAEIVILSSSDGILRGSSRLHSQNLAMARIRAVEIRKPIIYASNAGKSFAVDEKGSIIWESRASQEEVINFSVNTNQEEPLAVRIHSLLLLAFGGISLIGIILPRHSPAA